MRATTTFVGAAVATCAAASVALTGCGSASADTVPAAPGGSPLLAAAAKLPKVSAQQVLSLAERQVGISEDSSGGGTKFHQWYMSTQRARETAARDGGSTTEYRNAAWCDMFVSWVGAQAGIRPVLGWDAYTVAHAKWFEANHRWGHTPKPGAVVFFNWKGQKSAESVAHVGFVIKDNGDGTIKTVEGNTGEGKVEIRTRPTSQVAGYGYPVYTA
ncbi:CHAP domain-containing protein [Streptosporangiaceae bacterium NEAU-GS5]|nr:CHAP domain-containing protein [Streptosporangiaceae bacterium NEAU-GS5]